LLDHASNDLLRGDSYGDTQQLINRLNSENQTLNNINQEQQEQITGLSERISHLITQTEKLTKLNKVLLVQMQELEEE
jgi:ABC-type transporter Mla subunit MlaD